MKNEYLELRVNDLQKVYAGVISLDDQNVLKHKFRKNRFTKSIYYNFWRYYIVGYMTALISLTGRKYMANQGVLHWDIEDSESFIIYSIRTRKNSSPEIIRSLFNEAEKICKIKRLNTMVGYSRSIKPSIARRLGWETKHCVDGFKFIKKIEN